MCTFVEVGSWNPSSGVSPVAGTTASGDSVVASGSSSSSSSIEAVRTVFVPQMNHGHTFSVHIRMLPEAILHGLELLHAINTLGLLFREHKTRESLPELHPAGSVSHSPQARTIPIDFSSFGVVSSGSWLRLS